jgi:hypothetical protein
MIHQFLGDIGRRKDHWIYFSLRKVESSHRIIITHDKYIMGVGHDDKGQFLCSIFDTSVVGASVDTLGIIPTQQTA